MTAWDIYWWVKLDEIQALLIILAVLTGVCLIISMIGYTMSNVFPATDFETPKDTLIRFWRKVLTYSTAPAIVFFIMAFSCPSTKQMAVIYLTPKIINSEATQELTTIPKDAAVMMRKLMDDWMAEYMPEKVMNQVGGGEGSKE